MTPPARSRSLGTNSNNLIGRGVSGSNISDGVNGNQVGPTTGTPLDAMLGLLQDNGGPMPTHALLVGSPAIDAGDSAAAATVAGLTYDQRGDAFARIFGDEVDIGGSDEATADSFERPDSATLGSNWAVSADGPNAVHPYRRRGYSSFPGGRQPGGQQQSDGLRRRAGGRSIGLENPTIQAGVNASDDQALAVGVAARIQSNGDAYVAVLTHDRRAEIWLVRNQTITVLAFAATPATSTSGPSSSW